MTQTTTFHDWLVAQSDQDSPVGDIARDYSYGVDLDLHAAANSPAELRAIVDDIAGDDSSAFGALGDVESAWSDALERSGP